MIEHEQGLERKEPTRKELLHSIRVAASCVLDTPDRRRGIYFDTQDEVRAGEVHIDRDSLAGLSLITPSGYPSSYLVRRIAKEGGNIVIKRKGHDPVSPESVVVDVPEKMEYPFVLAYGMRLTVNKSGYTKLETYTVNSQGECYRDGEDFSVRATKDDLKPFVELLGTINIPQDRVSVIVKTGKYAKKIPSIH